MSDDIAQWLAEVRSLQKQISSLQQEREQAYQSAENWRKLYESEAQQRRRDAAVNGQKIEKLEQALTHYQSPQSQSSQSQSSQSQAPQSQSSQGQSLQNQLTAAQQQCDQLKRSLQAEEKAHAQTRESLTAALGDTVDLLTKERLGAMQQSQSD